MNDFDATPACENEARANFWHEEAYRAGHGAAALGTSLADAIREAERSGAPFGDDERAALVEGFWDRIRFERDMRDENDRPRAA
jgi:hypothetical protein